MSIPTSITLNTTFTHNIGVSSFGGLSTYKVNNIFKDGRVFSHFVEAWLEEQYPIIQVGGCKPYDFVDSIYNTTKYDEKTFTKRGCAFCPSNMLGKGRVFNSEVFQEKTAGMIFCIVSNVNFPEIKVRFVRGTDLLVSYPKGRIPIQDHVKFFG